MVGTHSCTYSHVAFAMHECLGYLQSKGQDVHAILPRRGNEMVAYHAGVDKRRSDVVQLMEDLNVQLNNLCQVSTFDVLC